MEDAEDNAKKAEARLLAAGQKFAELKARSNALTAEESTRRQRLDQLEREYARVVAQSSSYSASLITHRSWSFIDRAREYCGFVLVFEQLKFKKSFETLRIDEPPTRYRSCMLAVMGTVEALTSGVADRTADTQAAEKALLDAMGASATSRKALYFIGSTKELADRVLWVAGLTRPQRERIRLVVSEATAPDQPGSQFSLTKIDTRDALQILFKKHFGTDPW